MDRDMIPVVDIIFRSLDEFQFLFRIINQGAELTTLRLTNVALEEFADLTAYVTRCIFQNMLESLTLSVQISQKVFCTLWQIEYGFKIDNLRSCRRNGRKRPILKIEHQMI